MTHASPLTLDFAAYRKKALGCWLGKAVGGTLGGPAEGKPGPLDLTFYDPVPDEMLPNDDLDLQVVWLERVRRTGLPISRRHLADAWLEHIHLYPDEYGVAARSLAQGIMPPASGAFDNGFTAGMGAAIRSEIWACLAPGDPALAVDLAKEDACVDHAGEGVHAELFLVSLQSHAFVESDRDALLDAALGAIPSDSRVARAIVDTREWWAESGDWRDVRKRILDKHGRQNFTDVAQNLAFTVLGWLAGEGDFGKAICTAVNCGRDTDCTGATLGALLGILAPDSIGEEWLKPIGRDMVLSPGIVGMHPAATLDEFTDQVADLALQVLDYYGSTVALGAAPNIQEPVRRRIDAKVGATLVRRTPLDGQVSLVRTDPVCITARYRDGVRMEPGKPSRLDVTATNVLGKPAMCKLGFRGPDGWAVELSGRGALCHGVSLAPGESAAATFDVTPPAGDLRKYRNPLDVWVDVDGVTVNDTIGLLPTLPWRTWGVAAIPDACPSVPGDAGRVEVPGHFVPLPDEACVLAADVKMAAHGLPRFVVQAPRRVRVWVDGGQVNEHDGVYHVPAFHRCRETGADVELKRGWHRLTIAVDPGQAGELFVGIGSGKGWHWLADVEWREIA